MQKKSIAKSLKISPCFSRLRVKTLLKRGHIIERYKTLSGITNLEELIKEKRLREIKGIGDALSEKIEEYSTTGSMKYLDELMREVPESLLELMQIP